MCNRCVKDGKFLREVGGVLVERFLSVALQRSSEALATLSSVVAIPAST